MSPTDGTALPATAEGAASLDPSIEMSSAGAAAPPLTMGCAQNPCAPGGECVADPSTGAPTCQCYDGFNGTGTSACVDIDDCAGNPCGAGGTCTDLVGGYSCTCAEGYTGTGTQQCVNIDDCEDNTCGPGGRCVDGVLGYTCDCDPGFSGSGTTRCTNIDDCAGDPCAPGGTCKDGVSSYTCTCSFSADTDNRCPHADNGDGTIYDADTMLTWQKSRTSVPWDTPEDEAFAICEGSRVAGGDWRIPTCDEVFSIMRVIDSTGMLCFQGFESLCCQLNSPDEPLTFDVMCVR